MKAIEQLIERHPELSVCAEQIRKAFAAIVETYRNDGRLLCCGNGGSAADSEHIVGELMKSFKRPRPIPAAVRTALAEQGPDGMALADTLEGSLAAIALVSHTALMTAYANDRSWDAAFAQQVLGLGRAGDAFIAISTSGNAADCVNAARVAKAKGLKTIALTGEGGGKLAQVCDVAICVPARETYLVQELHLPVYHALCAAVEDKLFG